MVEKRTIRYLWHCSLQVDYRLKILVIKRNGMARQDGIFNHRLSRLTVQTVLRP